MVFRTDKGLYRETRSERESERARSKGRLPPDDRNLQHRSERTRYDGVQRLGTQSLRHRKPFEKLELIQR